MEHTGQHTADSKGRQTYPLTEDGRQEDYCASKPRKAAEHFANDHAKELFDSSDPPGKLDEVIVVEDATNEKLITYGVTVQDVRETSETFPGYHPAIQPASSVLDEKYIRQIDDEKSYVEQVKEATPEILADRNSFIDGEKRSWDDIDLDEYLEDF